MAKAIGPELRKFFSEKLPAIITTINESGQPEMTPIWYEFADDKIRFNGTATRKWLKRMEQSGRATFMVIDPNNMWRWAQVYGNVVNAQDDQGGDHINSLSHRYLDRDYSNDRNGRRILDVEITSVKGSNTRGVKWDLS
ncbi:MAG TPA: pyridoxamine 5'-phosphate oxidase family protein [Chloroflexota bacterium]|nr:pyridoxamine 5'-phosphate oxidase family protein [Chloroflexota bacterium]